MNPSLSSTFVLPAHATTAAFNQGSKYLSVGSDDGTVRVYQPPEPKVRKAIRGLGAPVSSVIFRSLKEGEELWVASGRHLYRFNHPIDSDNLILTKSDASFVKEIGQDDEDVVNQLVLNSNGSFMACTTDNGDVYVMDVSSASYELLKMKTSHNSIAWTACFIPDRPSELLTGGYDCSLLLHDFKLRTLLARLDITPAPSIAPGISSLPPFVTALALSSQGAVAAGTADGRICVGLGGVKPKPFTSSSSSSKKKEKPKRSRKWLGLNEEEGFFVKVGESLIAGLHFMDDSTLLSCTVHGKFTLHRLTTNHSLSAPGRQGEPPTSIEGLQELNSFQSSCAKVDALAIQPQPSANANDQASPATSGGTGISIAVAGLHEDKKRGSVELWDLRSLECGSEGDGTNTDKNLEGEKKEDTLEGNRDDQPVYSSEED